MSSGSKVERAGYFEQFVQFSGPCNQNKGFWKFAKLLGGKKVNELIQIIFLCQFWGLISKGISLKLFCKKSFFFPCPLDFVWIKRTNNIISLFYDRPCTFCNLVEELMLWHNGYRLLLQWNRWGNTISAVR